MPYFIIQFKKPKKHRAGQVNVDVGQIGDSYPNLHKAEKALYNLMDINRYPIFLRIDRNVLRNSVIYADLGINGGVVRFRKRDQYHFTSAIPLIQFGRRLVRRELYLKKRGVKT